MTTTAAPARLPGVYFLPPRRVSPEAIPPLDVAAFVGHAERGPLNLPVALEDARQYADVFGGDLPLARDERGQIVNAHLPDAVKSFFANGGRRCYAVRVAGNAARAAVFSLPGVIALDGSETPRLALVEASSQGTWANPLRMATRLATLPLSVAAFQRRPETLLWNPGPNAGAIEAGDVLRIEDSAGGQFLVPVTDVQLSTDRAEPAVLSTRRAIRIATVTIAAATIATRVSRINDYGPQVLDLQATLTATSNDGATLEATGPDAASLRDGDWLQVDLAAGTAGLLQIENVRARGQSGAPPVSVFLVHTGPISSLTPGPLSAMAPGGLKTIERLRFDLQLSLDDAVYPAISDLSFSQGGSRFWGDVSLMESSPLFKRSLPGRSTVRPAQATTPSAALLAAAEYRNYRQGIQPSYPVDSVLGVQALAGLLAPLFEEGDAASRRDFTYLPLGMATLIREDQFEAPMSPGDDGLSAHSAASFLDPALSDFPARDLLSEAWDRAYVQGRRLLGIHSLLTVDEVSLAATPDAVHLGWQPGDSQPPQPLPPVPQPAEEPCNDLAGDFDQCNAPPAIASLAPGIGSVLGGTVVVIEGSGHSQAPVSVRFGRKPAPDVIVVSDTQLSCVTPPSDAPSLLDVSIDNAYGTTTLNNAFTYYADTNYSQLPDLRPAADDPDLANSALLQIHKALLVVCQARQDMVALLSLPRDFDGPLCLTWLKALRTGLGLPPQSRAPDLASLSDLSYAAVYHPWPLLLDATAAGGVRTVPPDGAIAGMIANREHNRGAWIAPANDILADAKGLNTSFSLDDWASLFDAQLNILRREPVDVRAMSAHTLADQPELLQLSTRRLLILLRKAVLTRGFDFVFQSNNQRFRDAIVARLHNLLQGMFERGAFAGSTPQEAYRVQSDAGLNTPQSVDTGQLIVLIQVAPSQPAEFITVALTATGQGTLQLSGV